MSAEDEAVVRRFYEEMNNGRKNELAAELFTADHAFHDPQVPRRDGPTAWSPPCRRTRTASTATGRSRRSSRADDKVVVRWTGTGDHVGEMNGIPPTGKPIRVDAIAIHRMARRQDRRDLGGLGHPRLPAAARRGPDRKLTQRAASAGGGSRRKGPPHAADR